MEARTAGTQTDVGFLSGYGAHIRALRQTDIDEHKIEMQDHKLADCVALDGEDLASELSAVVDLRTRSLVWSSVPHITNTETGAYEMRPIPEELEPDFVRATSVFVLALFPDVPLPS